MMLVDRQVDFPMPGHVFKRRFHVRLLHEAELQGDGYDARILVLVEDRDAITAIVDVGHLAVCNLHEDQMARQYTVAVMEKLQQSWRIVVERRQMFRRHQKADALHVGRFPFMELDQPAHRHGVFGGIGRESGLPSPSPGAHDGEDGEADPQGNISALQKLK